MISRATLATEMSVYQALSDSLRADFEAIDQETLQDTLEGLSDLPEILQAIIRSSLLDEAMATGLKARVTEMRGRLERLEAAHDRKRALVCQTMAHVNLDKLTADDFTVSRRLGQPKLEVADEALVPDTYKVPQQPRLDRTNLLLALKAGDEVPGASLTPAVDQIQVRTK